MSTTAQAQIRDLLSSLPTAKATPPNDPSKLIETRYGRDAIHAMPGVEGPATPIMVEARSWERLEEVMRWACQQIDPAAAALREAERRADETPRLEVLGIDPADPKAAIATLSALARRPGAAKDPLGRKAALDRATGAAPAALEGPSTPAVQPSARLCLVATTQPAAAGVNYMPAKSAWDAAAKASAGAPMAVFWQQPETRVCQVAVVQTTDAPALRDSVFRCDSVMAHGGGNLVMSYEDGKLGPTTGPGMRFLDAKGAATAPPVFCLEGAKVTPEAHAAGRPTPFSGEALGLAIVAQAQGGGYDGFKLPGAMTRCSLAGLADEFAKAEKVIQGWLVANEPGLRRTERGRNLSQAETFIQDALGQVSGARRDIDRLAANGAVSANVDFAAFGGGARGFAAGLASELDTQAKLQIDARARNTLEYGVALRGRA